VKKISQSPENQILTQIFTKSQQQHFFQLNISERHPLPRDGCLGQREGQVQRWRGGTWAKGAGSRALGCGFCVMWDGYLVLPSGYVKIAIENGDL